MSSVRKISIDGGERQIQAETGQRKCAEDVEPSASDLRMTRMHRLAVCG